MFSGTAQFSHEVCKDFVPSVRLPVRVTIVDRNKSVVRCLLPSSTIMLFEKKKCERKIRSKMSDLKRNIP